LKRDIASAPIASTTGVPEIDADVRSLVRRKKTRLGMLDPPRADQFAV